MFPRKILFNFVSCYFLSICYIISINTGQILRCWHRKKANFNIFYFSRYFIMGVTASRIDFEKIWRSFCKRRTYSDQTKSRWYCLEWTNLIFDFYFYLMIIMTFKLIVCEQYIRSSSFLTLFFFCLLVSLINELSNKFFWF